MKSQPAINLTGLPFAGKLPSSAEISGYDQATIKSGTPSIELMERAGMAMSSYIIPKFGANKTALVLCGPGNNGGDGFVVARELKSAGHEVTAIIVTATHYSADCLTELKGYLAKGGKCLVFGQGATGPDVELVRCDGNLIGQILTNSNLIIDALLGTGQVEAPKGAIAELLHVIKDNRNSAAHYIAIDLPTGMNATTGMAWDPGFAAELTLTVELAKRGMVQYPARELCGEIRALSIGLDCTGSCEFELLTPDAFSPLVRPDNAHKGTVGTVLIIGGSLNMPGAPTLSALAALRTGCGLVIKSRLKSTPEPETIPEIILRTVDDHNLGFFTPAELDSLKSDIERADVVVLGPGLGTAKETQPFVFEAISLLHSLGKKVVVDADALNLIAAQAEVLSSIDSSCVITPHPGEASRLLNTTTSQVQNDRYGAAKSLIKLTSGAAVILKGAFSIIQGMGGGFVNSTGNRYMATAGSGDVLSGIVAGYIAQGLSPIEAAKRGAFIHGLAGDLAHQSTKGAIIASDLLNFIGHAENLITEAND